MEIIIVGAGKLGSKLAENLSHENSNITLIDVRQEALDKVAGSLDVLTVKANGAQVSALEHCHIRKTDVLISVTDSDETNMIIGFVAKRLGCKRVIARIRNPEYHHQASFLKTELNIDYVVNPELETAREIAKYLLKGQGVHMEPFAQGLVAMAEVQFSDLPHEGRKVKDLHLPPALLCVAVSHHGETVIPHGDTTILPTDRVYIIGKRETLTDFHRHRGVEGEKKSAKKVIILGGGKAGFYLANKLSQNGVVVKIVEQSQDRCQYLTDHLKNVLVICGDCTDNTLLQEENTQDMDALVALTGHDEENLLLALLGKSLKIRKTIAKVSRPNFIPVIEQLGINRAINPVLITVAEILRFIQGGQVASMALLLGGDAEVLEIIAKEDTKGVNKELKDIGLPKGIIIGSIVHAGEVIIPAGDAVIRPGDRVVIFCLRSEVATLERFFYKGKGGLLGELWSHYKSARKTTGN